MGKKKNCNSNKVNWAPEPAFTTLHFTASHSVLNSLLTCTSLTKSLRLIITAHLLRIFHTTFTLALPFVRMLVTWHTGMTHLLQNFAQMTPSVLGLLWWHIKNYNIPVFPIHLTHFIFSMSFIRSYTFYIFMCFHCLVLLECKFHESWDFCCFIYY